MFGRVKVRSFCEHLNPESISHIKFGAAGEPGVHKRVKKYAASSSLVGADPESFCALSTLNYEVELCFTDDALPPNLVCSTTLAQDEITIFYIDTIARATPSDRLSLVVAVPTKIVDKFERDIAKMVTKID